MQSACSTKNRARHTACANCLLVNGCILSNAGSVSSNQAVTLGSGASRSRASSFFTFTMLFRIRVISCRV